MSQTHRAFKPPRRARNVLVRITPPVYHATPYASGGLRRLYMNIRNRTVPKLHSHGEYTDASGVFCVRPEMPLLACRYRILQQLGKGQSCVFVEAQDTFQNDMLVSIKVLHVHYYVLGAQESDCIRRLNAADPHKWSSTLHIYNTFTFDDHYCMVFELLQPQPLTYYCRQLSANEVMPCMRTVAAHLLQALGFLQHNNVIHADLKPENVLLKTGFEFGSLKVVDFGNAIHCVHQELSLYYDDFELQTLLYRAPEVIFGLPFGLEIDMWSLGCILAEIYMGRPIFHGKDKRQVLHKLALALNIGSMVSLQDTITSLMVSPKSVFVRFLQKLPIRGDPSRQMTELLGFLPEEIFRSAKFFPELKVFTGTASNISDIIANLMSQLPTRDYMLADFIGRLLVLNPRERMTVSQAACHPFLAPMFGFANLLPRGKDRSYHAVPLSRSEYTWQPFIPQDLQKRCLSSVELLHEGTGSWQLPGPGKDVSLSDMAPRAAVRPTPVISVSHELRAPLHMKTCCPCKHSQRWDQFSGQALQPYRPPIAGSWNTLHQQYPKLGMYHPVSFSEDPDVHSQSRAVDIKHPVACHSGRKVKHASSCGHVASSNFTNFQLCVGDHSCDCVSSTDTVHRGDTMRNQSVVTTHKTLRLKQPGYESQCSNSHVRSGKCVNKSQEISAGVDEVYKLPSDQNKKLRKPLSSTKIYQQLFKCELSAKEQPESTKLSCHMGLQTSGVKIRGETHVLKGCASCQSAVAECTCSTSQLSLKASDGIFRHGNITNSVKHEALFSSSEESLADRVPDLLKQIHCEDQETMQTHGVLPEKLTGEVVLKSSCPCQASCHHCFHNCKNILCKTDEKIAGFMSDKQMHDCASTCTWSDPNNVDEKSVSPPPDLEYPVTDDSVSLCTTEDFHSGYSSNSSSPCSGFSGEHHLAEISAGKEDQLTQESTSTSQSCSSKISSLMEKVDVGKRGGQIPESSQKLKAKSKILCQQKGSHFYLKGQEPSGMGNREHQIQQSDDVLILSHGKEVKESIPRKKTCKSSFPTMEKCPGRKRVRGEQPLHSTRGRNITHTTNKFQRCVFTSTKQAKAIKKRPLKEYFKNQGNVRKACGREVNSSVCVQNNMTHLCESVQNYDHDSGSDSSHVFSSGEVSFPPNYTGKAEKDFAEEGGKIFHQRSEEKFLANVCKHKHSSQVRHSSKKACSTSEEHVRQKTSRQATSVVAASGKPTASPSKRTKRHPRGLTSLHPCRREIPGYRQITVENSHQPQIEQDYGEDVKNWIRKEAMTKQQNPTTLSPTNEEATAKKKL